MEGAQMKRIYVIAASVLSTLATSGGGLALAYNLVVEREGGALMLVGNDQAAECKGGGGCWVLSARQLAYLIVAGQKAEPPKQKGRTDI
jgi:hypothetical protein